MNMQLITTSWWSDNEVTRDPVLSMIEGVRKDRLDY